MVVCGGYFAQIDGFSGKKTGFLGFSDKLLAGDWPKWLVILLHELERQAMALLVKVIEARLDAGQWPPVI